MTDRPRPPKPRPKKRGRKHDRYTFRTLPGEVGDLLDDDLRVLDWLGRHVAALGYPPSVRELQEVFALPSTKTAFDVLRRLEAYGFLDLDPGVTRGVRLINLPPVKDQGATRLRLWLAEAAHLIDRWAPEDDPAAQAFLRKVRTATY